MTARPPMANRCCVDRAYHIRLIRSNRLCCYRSSHTFSIIDLFAAYHTHLVKLNRFCSHGSTQTVHPSELYAVYHTHLHLAARFCCFASSQIVYPSELYAVYHTCLHLFAYFFCLPHRKQFIELNRIPIIAHTTKIWTVFDVSTITNVMHLGWLVFLHHCLQFMHHT